jgi:hypothetical protein
MDNEVVIKVVADDQTDRGFTSARAKSKRLGTDIDTDVRKIAPKIGDNMGGGMVTGLLSRVPMFGGAAGIIGGIMAPTLGGLMAAGVMGAAGGAGIIGGLTLAAKDPAVKGAAESLKTQVGDDLKEASSSFVPVALESLGKVRQAWKTVLPDVRSIFQDSSKLVAPLLDGMISGAQRIIGSIRGVVANSGPVFEAFGNAFDNIADAVADVFDDLSDDADAAGASVDDLSNALGNMIRAGGKVVNFLAEWKGKTEDLDGWIDSMRQKLEDKTGWDITADGMTEAEEKAKNLTDALEKEAQGHDDAKNAAAGQRSALKALSDEMRAQADPVFKLLRAEDALRKAQDEVNESTKKHGRNSRETREAVRKLAESALDMESAAGSLADTFSGEVTPELRATWRAAGLTDRQIESLEKQFRSAKKQGDGFAKRYQASVGVTGASAARRALYSVEDAARDIPRAVTVALRITGTRNVSAAAAAIRKQYAHGGITGAQNGATSDGLTWVGEGGPELLDLPPGTSVKSNPDSMRMAAEKQSQVALNVVLSFDPSGAPEAIRGLMTGLRAEIRGLNGGNVQQALGQPGRG